MLKPVISLRSVNTTKTTIGIKQKGPGNVQSIYMSRHFPHSGVDPLTRKRAERRDHANGSDSAWKLVLTGRWTSRAIFVWVDKWLREAMTSMKNHRFPRTNHSQQPASSVSRIVYFLQKISIIVVALFSKTFALDLVTYHHLRGASIQLCC